MRVLIVATFIPPHVGGLEIIVEQQAKSLAAMGHKVTVLTSRHDPALASEEFIDGYRVVRTPTWNEMERRTAVPYPIWGVRSIRSMHSLVRDADVVHIHDVYYQPTMLAACFARWLRRPLFITQHVSIVEHDRRLVMAVQRLVYATIGARMWSWGRTVIAYNVIVYKFLAERGVPESKLYLTYNGIDINAFTPGDPTKRKVVRDEYGVPQHKPLVLFVGRLVPKKGYRELIAAHDNRYEIVLVGPGPIPTDLPPGVTLTGPIERSRVLELYQASDLFVFPAVGEMLTLAMQEAMACGLPVVTTDESAYAQYGLDTTGIALVPAEPAVLRNTMNEIFDDDERRARMGVYSRKLAIERFDWRRNAADLSAIYQITALGPKAHSDEIAANADRVSATEEQC